jgi:hypothetical protein
LPITIVPKVRFCPGSQAICNPHPAGNGKTITENIQGIIAQVRIFDETTEIARYVAKNF